MKKILPICCIFICLFFTACKKQDTGETGGYLFAHMLTSDYGRLYYSISRDGRNWELLHDSLRVDSLYRGHPDICQGADGAYYMIGAEKSPARPVLWKSKDLVSWKVERKLPVSLFLDNHTGHTANSAWYGAPKLFFDEASDHFMITWHAPKNGVARGDDWWRSMRTFYTLTRDFEKFTEPERLFYFRGSDKNMATIDAVIRKAGTGYYAIIKDERWPQDTPVGKTIRMASSASLTGPYSDPGVPVTPSWHEAPTVVPRIGGKGWNMYVESYPERYVLYTADSLNGSWSAVETNLEGVRHGCVLRINEQQYKTLKTRF